MTAERISQHDSPREEQKNSDDMGDVTPIRSSEGKLILAAVQHLATDVAEIQHSQGKLLREVAGNAASTVLLREEVALVRIAISEIAEIKKKVEALPPMREETRSSADLTDQMRRGVISEFSQLARRTPGPKVESTPEQLTAVVTPIFESMLAEREEALKVRADRERLAAIDKAAADAKAEALRLLDQAHADREKFKRKLVYGSILAFFASLAGAIGTYTFGQMSGHDTGVAEGRTAEHRRMEQAPPNYAAPAATTTVSAPVVTHPAP